MAKVEEAKAAVEIAKDVAEVAAVGVGTGVVTGALDYKKVAIVAGVTVGVIGAAYFGKKFYDKRKAAKMALENIDCEGELPETIEVAEAPKEKK